MRKEDVDKHNNEVWSYALTRIVDEVGTDSSDLEICVYGENTIDHDAAPLFKADRKSVV